jgi:uncharacterized membrane protein
MASRRILDDTFRISVTVKGLDGALEAIGGAILLFVQPQTINHVVHVLTQHELSHDPNDFVARHLLRSAQRLHRSTAVYASIYLLSHGIAKVVLVIAVLRRHRWAYLGLIALLLAFIAYQLYRLALRFTVGLTLLTVFDAFVVLLTWREYRGTAPTVAADDAPRRCLT